MWLSPEKLLSILLMATKTLKQVVKGDTLFVINFKDVFCREVEIVEVECTDTEPELICFKPKNGQKMSLSSIFYTSFTGEQATDYRLDNGRPYVCVGTDRELLIEQFKQTAYERISKARHEISIAEEQLESLA